MIYLLFFLQSALATEFRFEVLAERQDVVWGFDFLSAERLIFSERGGKLGILDLKTKSIQELSGVPKVWHHGQGGLLDVRVNPKRKDSIFFVYSDPKANNSATTTLARARISGNALTDIKKILVGHEANSNDIHFGSRIEFDDKGHLFISMGDRSQRERAQGLQFHQGKIWRINEDGSAPQDNPFIKTAGAKKEIWSLGHRNPQGLALRPGTNELWSAEMGPRGGDELNLVQKGANYGWPIITYGREYWGPKIGETHKDVMEQPIAYWVPSISPSALAFYSGDKFPQWKGNAFLACLSGMQLRRIVLDGQKVVQQEELLKDLKLRFRNIRSGPDGFLYLSTDDGKIARLIK